MVSRPAQPDRVDRTPVQIPGAAIPLQFADAIDAIAPALSLAARSTSSPRKLRAQDSKAAEPRCSANRERRPVFPWATPPAPVGTMVRAANVRQKSARILPAYR